MKKLTVEKRVEERKASYPYCIYLCRVLCRMPKNGSLGFNSGDVFKDWL